MSSTSSECSDWSLKSSSPQSPGAGSQSCRQFYPPPVQCYPTPRDSPEGCLFHGHVFDECYQSRFWARVLEYFLLDNEQHGPIYQCLMVSCPEKNFNDPKNMLLHLKKCQYFPQGKFYCPKCREIESFKVVSKKCAWDKINWAHKLLQKSLKVLQSFSVNHSPYSNCPRGISTTAVNGSFVNSQIAQSNLPMPPIELHTPFNQTEQASIMAQAWELLGTPISSDINEMLRQRSNTKTRETAQHLSYNEASIPGTPGHQTSPAGLASTSFGQPAFWGNFSPSSTTLTNDPLDLGAFPLSSNTPVIMPLPPARQASRPGETALLTVDTSQPVRSILTPDLEYMLLDEGETLGPGAGTDPHIIDSTQGIMAPQPSEMTPFDAQYVPNEELVPQSSTYLHPSPSTSVPSSSNYDMSPSSTSSEQCHYPGCSYKPTGKNKQAYMRKHLKTHEKNEIPCDYCDTTCSRQDNLTCHIRKAHPTIYETISKRRRGSSGSLQSPGQPQRKGSRKEVMTRGIGRIVRTRNKGEAGPQALGSSLPHSPDCQKHART
ncbi:hypothetical protein O1611_g4695 [Lasiodiplodia mahajangana]|uniref:Uncharacterized protein n=1 Tax=Lasiodiplodia mahajangana TaxID=1108764 RepID=A0ACC2JNW2_9PEZI|nr:hypothetical protein O1611_g4695 [Lasiodiplodia mahajangana]